MISTTLAHVKGVSIVFSSKPKVNEDSLRKLRQTNGAKAYITTQADVRSRRRCASHQLKVPVPV
jgi:hypothetical protein